MIKVAYCNIDDLDLYEVYKLLPESRKKKVDHFRFDKDKKLSAGAYLLLDRMLKDENITDPIFKTGKYGKAHITNYDDIHFNLSHSNKLVACAISNKEVGIDVEFNDPEIDLNIAKHYFYNSEYANIINSPNPSNEFFNYWVLKESYMKYTGLGFQLALDSFEIMIKDNIQLKGNDELKFNLFDVENCKLAVCGHHNVKDIINLKPY